MISTERFHLPSELGLTYPALREWCEHGIPVHVSLGGDDSQRNEEFTFDVASLIDMNRQRTLTETEDEYFKIGTYQYSLARVSFTRDLMISMPTGNLVRVDSERDGTRTIEFVNSSPFAFERCAQRYLEILEDCAKRRMRRSDVARIWKEFKAFVDTIDPHVDVEDASMWKELIADQIQATEE